MSAFWASMFLIMMALAAALCWTFNVVLIDNICPQVDNKILTAMPDGAQWAESHVGNTGQNILYLVVGRFLPIMMLFIAAVVWLLEIFVWGVNRA